MKPRVRCYQFDDYYVYFVLPNKVVYRIQVWSDGRSLDKCDDWNVMFDKYNYVPWVGF